MDAAYKAVDSLVRVEADLIDYSVSSVTQVRGRVCGRGGVGVGGGAERGRARWEGE